MKEGVTSKASKMEPVLGNSRARVPFVHSGIAPPSTTPHDIVKKIMTSFDPLEILNCAGNVLTGRSTEADIRKAYLWLSTKIHPDKLQGVEQATEAFQLVLRAYETTLKSLNQRRGSLVHHKILRERASRGPRQQITPPPHL